MRTASAPSGWTKEPPKTKELPREAPVMRTSTPQEEVSHKKAMPTATGRGLSTSVPIAKPCTVSPPQVCDRSTKSLPALPGGLGDLGTVLDRAAQNWVAVPTRRSSEERRLARSARSDASVIKASVVAASETRVPAVAQAGWNMTVSQQTPARSASGSLADATEKELQVVADQDEEEDDDEEEDGGEEDCQSEHSAGRAAPRNHPVSSATDTVRKADTARKEPEEPRPASAQKTHWVNAGRMAQMSEEEERLSEYLIEAHAMELEPQAWRQTLNNEGTTEHRMWFYKELDSNLEDRRRRIDRLLHLIMEFGEPYTKCTRVNEVMIKLRGMRRADDEIWKTLVKCREKCLIAKAHAVHGSGYHSMRFVLPEKFGTKSYIDVDRPLSRLQRCTDKNKHQIRTWMEKLFHTTATWEMSEQAYHEAIMNMMEGDVGAQAFRLKDLSLQDIIDTLIAKYDTTHRTPEELNEELRKIKREKHQSGR